MSDFISYFIRDDAESLIQYGETGTAPEPFCTPQNEETEARQEEHDKHCAALIIFLSDWSSL